MSDQSSVGEGRATFDVEKVALMLPRPAFPGTTVGWMLRGPSLQQRCLASLFLVSLPLLADPAFRALVSPVSGATFLDLPAM